MPKILMGRRSLRAKIVKQLIWRKSAKSGSKMGFVSLAGGGSEVGPKWVSVRAVFGEGDATKHISVKKRVFQ